MSALSDPYYINLKTSFLTAMKAAIESNKNVTLSQFPERDKMISHLDIIKGWEQAVENFEKICDSIEAPALENPAPQNDSPTITEGEIVE